MRFSPHLLDEIRARLPVSSVVGRRVALKKKGREYSGLSPFKTERTPSFFVNDQKGFYHCFASGEHGDIFTFLMKTEGLAFPEAVERLAAEAGVTLPKPDARSAAHEDQRTRLLAITEASAKFFQAALSGPEGGAARSYLDRRGLAHATLREFRIGFAPNSKSALRAHLAAAGFSLPEMVASGMLIGGDDIPSPYDRFRNRVMFPIADAKGRIVAFGGRALDPAAPAKYLNSPETPLFHKGALLFNAHRARPAAHTRQRIVVVEGYMDAISLAEAGVPEVVAPLGTALTEDQIEVLWRIVPEPILCFDGDSAGRKAAWRAIDTVLPHLKPGTSLMFAFLPDGLDPDDLIRAEGRDAFEAVLARAKPLVDVLCEREFAAGDVSTPERRARLDQALRRLVSEIRDPSVRGHYEREVRQRLGTAWGTSAPQRSQKAPAGYPRRQGTPSVPGKGRPSAQGPRPWEGPSATDSLRNSAVAQADTATPPPREALLVQTLLNHPWLIDDHAEAIAALEFRSSAVSGLRDAILSVQALDNSLDSKALRSQLSRSGADRLIHLVARTISHKCDRFAGPEADRAEVEAGWRHALAVHERHFGLKRSLAAAELAWHEDGTEEALARILDLQRQIEALAGSEPTEDPVALSANGER